jgi:hypothetical protein
MGMIEVYDWTLWLNSMTELYFCLFIWAYKHLYIAKEHAVSSNYYTVSNCWHNPMTSTVPFCSCRTTSFPFNPLDGVMFHQTTHDDDTRFVLRTYNDFDHPFRFDDHDVRSLGWTEPAAGCFLAAVDPSRPTSSYIIDVCDCRRCGVSTYRSITWVPVWSRGNRRQRRRLQTVPAFEAWTNGVTDQQTPQRTLRQQSHLLLRQHSPNSVPNRLHV